MIGTVAATADPGAGARVVPFAAPHLGAAEIDAVTAVLTSSWIGTGAVTATAEREFANYLGLPHTLLVNSGTAALHLALLSLGVGPGDEVIVPTVTFAASAAAVVHAGARPVLVDVEPGTLLADVEQVRDAVTPRTRAVVAVHVAGRMADVRALRRLCDEHDLLLVEDSAHALPARRDGLFPGQLADAAAFSFFVTKPLTCAEGGLLATRSGAALASARTLSTHGIDRGGTSRHLPGQSPHYDIVAAGLKYNLPDISSALLRCQLRKADWMWRRRQNIAATYRRGLAGVPGLRLPSPDIPGNQSSWYLFVVELPSGVDRDAVAARLWELGVGTSVHFRPLHQFTYYRDTWVRPAQRFPAADAAYPSLLSLPIYPGMADDDPEVVVAMVRRVLGGGV